MPEALAAKNPKPGEPVPGTGLATRIRGAQKAFLFLVSLEESTATRILSFLSSEEVQRLRGAADTLPEVDPQAILSVHEEFLHTVKGGVPTSLKGSGAYLRRLAGKALGEGKVAELWSETGPQEGPVAQLAKLDVPTLMGILEKEHPQTLAVILAQLEPTRAGDLIQKFSSEKQSQIIMRLAQLKSIPEAVIRDIERQFAKELELLGDTPRMELDGILSAANLLKRLDNDLSEQLIDEVASIDQEMAEKLRKALFTFEDLILIDGRGMQVLLKEVATDQLVLALKSASEDLREKIFGNVSSRAAAMLREELEMLGPVRLQDVEQAQSTIVEVALNLEREKRIQIAREGSNDYV